jgi:hypothetical protein
MDRSWLVPYEGAALSYRALRTIIGSIGIGLPIVLPVGVLLLAGQRLPTSVSGYYYTDMRNVFVASMCVIGVFLLAYRFGPADNLLAAIAGTAAIGLALAPTARSAGVTGWEQAAGVLHLVFAAMFFLALATFCLALFTLDDGRPTPQKRQRNVVYRICGVVILGCLVLGVVAATAFPSAVDSELRPLFWLQSLAVLAFGVAWFVKGETLVLRDEIESPSRAA